MPDKNQGIRLKEVRKKLKISSTDFAAEFNIQQSYVSRMENGLVEIPASLLSDLYKKYKALPHYICNGLGKEFENKEDNKTVTDISAMKADILALKAKVDYLTKKL
ncbi:helix-turn-helix transcriptional regulator [Pedobacter sp. HDW13]|uniref:helix-turn-helix domain-containing protein n=1 Tax=Pedobacter sp. HDW13 TaxID=2714940 RepID=UPI00140B2AA3|nr:helix-turn-helix transcriptional regulator [Pedobacter sp. HDW13]QIL40990.1 helix-turn-helix transcriptional regulator [Pedobacter sp. HDW13]